MCQAKSEGGRRCPCSGQYSPKVAAVRRSNNDYRKALAAAVRRKGHDELADRVAHAPFTAMPELTNAAGLEPHDVSSAALPGTVKRHPLSDESNALINDMTSTGVATAVLTPDTDGDVTDGEDADGELANPHEMDLDQLTDHRAHLTEQLDRLDKRIIAAEERGRFTTADALTEKFGDIEDEVSVVDSLIEDRKNGVEPAPFTEVPASDNPIVDDEPDDQLARDRRHAEWGDEEARAHADEHDRAQDRESISPNLEAMYDDTMDDLGEAWRKFTKSSQGEQPQTMHEAARAITQLDGSVPRAYVAKTNVDRITPGHEPGILRAVESEFKHVNHAKDIVTRGHELADMLESSSRNGDKELADNVRASLSTIDPDVDGGLLSPDMAVREVKDMLNGKHFTEYDRAKVYARYNPQGLAEQQEKTANDDRLAYPGGYNSTDRYTIDDEFHADNVIGDVYDAASFNNTPECCETPLSRELRRDAVNGELTDQRVETLIRNANQDDIDALVGSSWSTLRENLDKAEKSDVHTAEEQRRFEIWHASVTEKFDRDRHAIANGDRSNVAPLMYLANYTARYDAPLFDDPDTTATPDTSTMDPLF